MRTLFSTPEAALTITPRAYQTTDHDESFRLWDEGEIGTLTRVFTGGGKTISACLKARTWLARSMNHRVMIVSYEKQLVWQFAQEVEDVLGITPGIEMEKESVDKKRVPPVVVASRQSLMLHKPPTAEMVEKLQGFGIEDYELGACPRFKAKSLLKILNDGCDPDDVRSHLIAINEMPECYDGRFSRLHKFDWQFDWLVIFDEAHRHAYSLTTVGPIVDWFDQNPNSRRNGLTATPKRADQISLGNRMFPAISIDYPLFAVDKPCAVKDGYAVPYVQRYIEVHGVDFASIGKLGSDFDDSELDKVLNTESQIAKLVEPLLSMVGQRSTLIFNPTVDMARNVARYINARREVVCSECGKRSWHSKMRIGDGAQCKCGHMLSENEITRDEDAADAVWGEVHPKTRREKYRGHQSGTFQFLCVCGLCREGYNDPNVSCVAIFRPVSKAASSLAEQMKGRGGRPLRGLIDGIEDRDERIKRIAESDKPNCLIVDLTGVSMLSECASTAQIYSEGLEDVVAERAEELLSECDEEADVEEVVQQARNEIEEERARIKAEREAEEARAREEAEKRAKAGAQVDFSEHDVGEGSAYSESPFGKGGATHKQMNFIECLGMKLCGIEITKNQAGRIIGQLKRRMPFEEVAHTNRIEESQWVHEGPSVKQRQWMGWKRIPHADLRCRYEAMVVRDAYENQEGFAEQMKKKILNCNSADDLTELAHDIKTARRVLRGDLYHQLAEAGRKRRQVVVDARPDDSF